MKFSYNNVDKEGFGTEEDFTITYGHPQIQFLKNNENFELTMEIISGSYTKYTIYDGGKKHQNESKQLGNKETLKAQVPLALVEGHVEPKKQGGKTYSVKLDLSEGSFKPGTLELSDDSQLDFNKKVKSYFTNNKIDFIINSLDCSNISSLNALTPSNFRFKNLHTKSGKEIVQLYIQTDKRGLLPESQCHLNNISEPIPDDYGCSLMISSKIFFQDVIPESLKASNWSAEGVEPKDSKAWSAQMTGGSISGTVDLSKINQMISHHDTKYVTHSYYIPGGDNVTWSTNGMNLKCNEEFKLTLEYEQKNPQPLKEQACRYLSSKPECIDHDLSVDVTLNLNASISASVTSISETTKEQLVQLKISPEDMPPPSGDISTHCNYPGLDIKSEFLKDIKEQIPGQITDKINEMKFNSISVFALENLLFPADKCINLTDAYIPGDFLILGNFIKKSET